MISLRDIVGIANDDVGINLGCSGETRGQTTQPQGSIGQPSSIPGDQSTHLWRGQFGSPMVLASTGGPNGSDLTETGSDESGADRRSNVPVQNSDGPSAREPRSHNGGKSFPLKSVMITPNYVQ